MSNNDDDETLRRGVKHGRSEDPEHGSLRKRARPTEARPVFAAVGWAELPDEMLGELQRWLDPCSESMLAGTCRAAKHHFRAVRWTNQQRTGLPRPTTDSEDPDDDEDDTRVLDTIDPVNLAAVALAPSIMRQRWCVAAVAQCIAKSERQWSITAEALLTIGLPLQLAGVGGWSLTRLCSEYYPLEMANAWRRLFPNLSTRQRHHISVFTPRWWHEMVHREEPLELMGHLARHGHVDDWAVLARHQLCHWWQSHNAINDSEHYTSCAKRALGYLLQPAPHTMEERGRILPFLAKHVPDVLRAVVVACGKETPPCVNTTLEMTPAYLCILVQTLVAKTRDPAALLLPFWSTYPAWRAVWDTGMTSAPRHACLAGCLFNPLHGPAEFSLRWHPWLLTEADPTFVPTQPFGSTWAWDVRHDAASTRWLLDRGQVPLAPSASNTETYWTWTYRIPIATWSPWLCESEQAAVLRGRGLLAISDADTEFWTLVKRTLNAHQARALVALVARYSAAHGAPFPGLERLGRIGQLKLDYDAALQAA